ncbi:hypothetical protein DO97_08635 [Neosynechococcus sphagnicola sy1]|uniref:UspA domain-containing protein n=1 Tax=Neosynechococcus sphagnicola sy1 TaxID=1497020 RepID=A0A098TJK5_9CYAN|nr:universal stress protein [Neosynechococcus sphagnicola]KGF72434.1 hypothetical protein DO97_08635 [Neosynechococcus sphagnicola sy1]
MFQRCLVCTDFADGLHRLIHFVPDLAAGGIRHLVFLHSVPLNEGGGIPRIDTEKIEQAQTRLSSALQQVPTGVEVVVEVQSGDPVERVLAVAKAYGSEVILMGMPSRNLLNEKLFGSNTIAVSQRAEIPILNLRPAMTAAFTAEELALRCQHLFRYLLLPYDGSDSAQFLVQQIQHYAQHQVSDSLHQCLLCWVVEEGTRQDALAHATKVQQAEAQLAIAKTNLESGNLAVTVEIRRGNPVTEVLASAQELDISAIAITSEHCGKFWELSIPSFGGEILRRSWHPVIFFPQQQR